MRRKQKQKVNIMDMNKHVSEGWRVKDFIQDLEPIFTMIQSGNAINKPFTNKADLKAWCCSNQPYYKKYIPEVVNYFAAKAGL